MRSAKRKAVRPCRCTPSASASSPSWRTSAAPNPASAWARRRAERGPEVVSIYNGLAQRDMRDVRSQAAMAVAAQEVVSFGSAWLQWMAVPVSVRNPFDKRLVLRAAANDRVYDDPYDDTREKSDMGWLIEVERMTLAQRDTKWPKAEGTEPVDFESVPQQNDWWFPSGSVGPERDRECRVAYYYRREYEEVEFIILPGWPLPMRVDQLPMEQVALLRAQGAQVEKSQVPYIEFSVVDGATTLQEPIRLPYTRIPYARLVGQVDQSPEGEEIARGIVYYLKDQSRYMSLTISDMLEKQVLNSADFWRVANESDTGDFDDTRRPGTRYYNAFMRGPGPNGELIPVPPPEYHSSNPAIEASMAVVGMIRDLMGVSSGAADAPIQEDVARHASIQVLDRLDRMQAVGRRTYVWWFSNVVMAALSEIWLDMSPATYGREGRIVRVAGESMSEDDQGAIIGVPFYRDAEGVPIAVPGLGEDVDRIPNPEAPDDPTMQHQIIRFRPDVDKVKLTPYAGITETSATDAALEMVTNIVQANPALGPALAPALVKSAAQRYPTMADAVDRTEAMFPSPVPPDMSAKDAPRIVAQLRTELQQTQEQLQVAQQAADQANAAREIEQMRAASREAVASINAAVAQAKADLDAKTKIALALGERSHEKVMQDDQQEHEAVLAGVDAGVKVQTAKKAEEKTDGSRTAGARKRKQ